MNIINTNYKINYFLIIYFINSKKLKKFFFEEKSYSYKNNIVVLCSSLFPINFKKPKISINKIFMKKSLTDIKLLNFLEKNKKNLNFFFINKFVIFFLEKFFQKKIFFFLKKGSNKIFLRQISFRKFSAKFFKKNLNVSKQIIGILYYTFLLKDSTIFVNFFKKSIESINIKLHKKLFLGLKKLIKDLFLPLFKFLGLLGVFFRIKGKIGVSGSAKKKTYFFSFGEHSITKKSIKVDIKQIPV